MGFFRKQEEQMALRLLAWRYKKMNIPPPGEIRLAEMASNLVEEAHRIARQRGKNVWTILKELVEDLKK
jgi:hypothetical protein